MDAAGVKRGELSNPQTGPFFIEGAERGDTLVVHLIRLETNRATGWSASVLAPYTADPLFLRREAGPLQAAVVRLAREERIWTFSFGPSDVPGVQRAELEVGDATIQFSPEEFRNVIDRLLRD